MSSPEGFVPPADAPPGAHDERLANASAQRQFWGAMSERIRQDERNMRYVLPCSVLAAGAVALVTRSMAWGGAVVVLGISIWLLGQYFVRVRAHEYAYNLAEAERELQSVQAQTRDPAGVAAAGLAAAAAAPGAPTLPEG